MKSKKEIIALINEGKNLVFSGSNETDATILEMAGVKNGTVTFLGVYDGESFETANGDEVYDGDEVYEVKA